MYFLLITLKTFVMKKILLSLSFFICFHFLKAQQAHISVVMNYTPGTCKVQVEYWVTNPTNGNGSIQIAVSNAAFQWDSTMFTLTNVISTAGGLDLSDIYSSDKPDQDVYGSRVVNGSTFRTLDILRSTNLCNNIYIINAGQSKPLATITLQFKNCNDANSYNFIDTTASNYIAEINDGVSTPHVNSKILAIVNKDTRPMDKSGSDCAPNQIIKNLNNVPVGDDGTAVFVSQAPLPVSFKEFNVYKQNNKASLVWETASEISNRGFEVQRKKGNTFQTIGFVNSKASNGNSSEAITYEFTDPDYYTGTVYYRLKQISATGNETYSEIKSLRISKALQVLVYPNPSTGKLNIILPDGNGTTDINMIDFSGKLIKTWNGYKVPAIQLEGLQRGIYTLLISNRETGERVAQKITIQ